MKVEVAVRRVALLLLGAMLALAPAIRSQERAPETNTVRGDVIDAITRLPVVGAQVELDGVAEAVTADSSGRFAFAGVAPGVTPIRARAVGYRILASEITVRRGLTRIRLEMERVPNALAPVTVQETPQYTGTRGRRFEDFLRRIEDGRGQYLTREQIEGRNASTVAELVRGMRGVKTECQGGRCMVRMARAPMGCEPEYYVDGNLVHSFGPETPVRDIQGLEVYTGASDAPAEFIGSNASCGVIAIWTKSAP